MPTTNRIMAAVLASIAFCAASAAPLPQPAFADAGACTNVALSALSSSGSLSFSLAFRPSASNNVEVAFGVDIDGDGALSPDERRMAAGWDRGALFMRGADGESVLQAAQPSAASPCEFRWCLRLRRGREPSRLAAGVDGSPVFASVFSAPPAWLYEPDWNMACVVVRGADVGGDVGAVGATVDGTVLMLR